MPNPWNLDVPTLTFHLCFSVGCERRFEAVSVVGMQERAWGRRADGTRHKEMAGLCSFQEQGYDAGQARGPVFGDSDCL